MIRTKRPNKGDLVIGHQVYCMFPKLPAVPAKIVSVSTSGHSVTVEIGQMLAVLGGMKRRWEWTWRRATNSYQPKDQPTKKIGCGLALVIR